MQVQHMFDSLWLQQHFELISCLFWSWYGIMLLQHTRARQLLPMSVVQLQSFVA